MRVGIIGIGNVGSHLLGALLQFEDIEVIRIWNRTRERAESTLADVASLNPIAAQKVELSHLSEFGDCELIVYCAGERLRKGDSFERLFSVNLEIAEEILSDLSMHKDACMIVTPPKLADIAALACRILKCAPHKIFGFGGDLSVNRLKYLLLSKEGNFETVQVIGDHPYNIIPVLKDESRFAELASYLKQYLPRVTALGGPTKNVAAGGLLADLVRTIIQDKREPHFVTGFHPELHIFITWPFTVGRAGLGASMPITLGTQASEGLKDFCSQHL